MFLSKKSSQLFNGKYLIEHKVLGDNRATFIEGKCCDTRIYIEPNCQMCIKGQKDTTQNIYNFCAYFFLNLPKNQT